MVIQQHARKYTHRYICIYIQSFIAVLLLCSPQLFASTDGALILERANSNENIYESVTGEFISYLRGDVVFLYEDIYISSDSATWQRSEGIIDFGGNVKVEQLGQIMTCDRLNLVRNNNLLTASGNVLYRDSAGITFIRGEIAEYMTDKSEALLRGNPLLTRVDSTNVDTLFISGILIRYNDSLKIATVTDNVNIRRGELNAICEKADYFINTGAMILRINPVIYYDSHRITGDSIDVFFGDESLDSAIVTGNAHGHYTEISDSTADTTVTHIWSDTLYVRMFEDGKVNAMSAFGNARAAYTEIAAISGNTTTANITSDSMFLFMFETGKIKLMKAFGSARGDYTEISLDAVNTITPSEQINLPSRVMVTNITSDSLYMFMFETGKISSIKAFSGERAHGRSADWSKTSASTDSTIMHIWGDSLIVLMSETGKINTMNAFGDVLSKHFSSNDSSRVNKASGLIMTLTFGGDGKISQAVVTGNAKSTYYIEESDGGGHSEISGNEIIVTFTEGNVRRLKILGNVKGVYFQ